MKNALRIGLTILLVTGCVLPGVSLAVVLYDEGREIIDGVSFLRDKEDETAYYYLPTVPSVAIDPATKKPKISLIKFVDGSNRGWGG